MHIIVLWLNDNAKKSPEEMSEAIKDVISIFNYLSKIYK